MVAKVKSKPVKTKLIARAASLKQLLDRLEEGKQKESIKTAAQTSLFTDGFLVTPLSKEERQEYVKPAAKLPKSCVLDLDPFFKLTVGPRLELKNIKVVKKIPIATLITVGGTEVKVLATQYLTLAKRHPKASFHMAFDDSPMERPIIVRENNAMVGFLKIYKEE